MGLFYNVADALTFGNAAEIQAAVAAQSPSTNPLADLSFTAFRATTVGGYTLGGAINQATGGTTRDWNPFVTPEQQANTISTFTKGISFYDPGAIIGDSRGSFQLPIFNQYGGEAAGQLTGWAANTAGDTLAAALRGLLGDNWKLYAVAAVGVLGLALAGPNLLQAATRKTAVGRPR